MKNNKRKVLGGIPAVFIVIVLLAMVLRTPSEDVVDAGNNSEISGATTATGISGESSDAAGLAESGDVVVDSNNHIEYHFRKDKYLQEHYEKHGIDMGFTSAEEYEKAASDVVNNPNALHKIEKEDNDDVYYIEETNEFVIISGDGYIRTYFNPDSGKNYFDKQ